MLTHRRKPVSLSLISYDLPVWSLVETAGTLYQKGQNRFHLLLKEPVICEPDRKDVKEADARENLLPMKEAKESSRLVWLEFSPYRATMTMQGNGKLGYRHLWERGMYGISRYWLQSDLSPENNQIRLRNYTRNLTVTGEKLPEHFRLEYELWAEKVRFGRYVLNLEIHH